MTIRDLLGAIWRRWYVFVLALLLAVTAYVALEHNGGSYASKPIVAFLLPGSATLKPDNGTQDDSVIGFAAAVAQEINNGRAVERYAADDAPLYGAGLREEVRVALPNAGGQWLTSYTRAEIAVSIVGPSFEWVERTQRELLDRVMEIAEAQQLETGADARARIQTTILPLSTNIDHIGSSTLAKVTALGALLTAAAIVGGWAALRLDRAVLARRKRRTSKSPATAGGSRSKPLLPVSLPEARSRHLT